MSKRESALRFLQAVADNQVREAYEQFIAPDFIHHNQYFKGDRQSLLLAMEEAHQQNPNTKIDVKHVFEDGDTVITHSHVRQQPEESGFAVVHIFKFRGEQIVESWDLGQPIANDSPNSNGPF